MSLLLVMDHIALLPKVVHQDALPLRGHGDEAYRPTPTRTQAYA